LSATVPGRATGHDVLFPTRAQDLRAASRKALADIPLQQLVAAATHSKNTGRKSLCREAFGDRYDAIRQLAGQIKQHTLDHLDRYLEQFVAAARANGTQIHFAKDGAQAREIILAIAAASKSKVCVKSKSMATEEIRLLPALEAAGVETIETDLGEFILQLDGDAPSHIVAPMIHKDRHAVARAFVRELGAAYTAEPRELTMIAREHMRAKYKVADLGISGANFLIAQTGSLVLCTNEGNADLAVAAPRVHVALVGIEKVIPSMAELPVFIKLLARSATAQPITVYTSLISGPRRATETEGPREVHIVLLDAGRTQLLHPSTRELLRCIRCGACLNACPVYRKVGGGHAYGSVYSGPIGATITPALRGLGDYTQLPQASSLCGACFEACPVHIDIPTQLVNLRRATVERSLGSRWERLAMKLWAWTMASPLRYRLCAKVQRVMMRAIAERDGEGRAWLSAAPPPIGAWTKERDLPAPAARSFRHQWKDRA